MKKISMILFALNFFFQQGQSQIIEQELKKSVITFIDSLTPLQQKRALLQFDDTAWIQWNNLPVGLRA